MAQHDDDHDKTVFGAIPRGPSPARPGAAPSGSPFGQSPSGGDRTIIGTPQMPGGGGHRPASGSGTWLGGHSAPGASPFGDSADIGRSPSANAGFFPDFAEQPEMDARPTTPRISLQDALKVNELGAASSANPLLAAAASLLILLGRLRTGMVELQVGPLMEHVTREIEQFERNALAAGVGQHESLVAKYALSGTADDIVQNLPGGGSRGSWQQYSMVARFFHKRDSGVGFFQEAEKAMQAPAAHYNLLELMLVCLSLGFEGQFRMQPHGAAELSRIRNAIYESLRRVNARPDEDISVMWTPVIRDRGRRFAGIPLIAALGIAAAATLAIFATLATLINRDGTAAAMTLRDLHEGAPVLQIERSPGAVFAAAFPQLETLRQFFAPEISTGQVAVEPKGDFIAIRVSELQLFDSGKVTLKPGFDSLAQRIAEGLNGEPGPIVVEGHSDNIPMSGRGRYKNNYQLSQARAEAVAAVLVPLLQESDRVRIEGRGADDPVDSNDTDAGRAANRRVDILLAREGTFDTPASPALPEASN